MVNQHPKSVNYKVFTLFGDGNTTAAFYWSQDLGQCANLPPSIMTPDIRANFINALNEKFGTQIATKYTSQATGEKQKFLRDVERFSKKEINDLSGSTEETSGLVLKLWGACILTCKYIDPRRKEITPDIRSKTFSETFDQIGKKDNIFSVGMKTAIAFCKLRKEKVSLKGVPKNSPVRV